MTDRPTTSMSRIALLSCAATVAMTVLAPLPTQAQQPKPNVVFILADNVGYGDLGSYGGGELRGAPTPRLDQLATQGLRLTQFLVEPACTPSRAALMTGQYSIRNGLSLIAIEGSPALFPAAPSRWASCSRPPATPRRSSASGTLGVRPAELADRARLRRVLRHSARHLAGTRQHMSTRSC